MQAVLCGVPKRPHAIQPDIFTLRSFHEGLFETGATILALSHYAFTAFVARTATEPEAAPLLAGFDRFVASATFG